MPDLSLLIVKTTVTPLADRQSRIEIALADDADPERATETVSISVVIEHGPVPFFLELQQAALDRVRTALLAQTRQIAQILGRGRP